MMFCSEKIIDVFLGHDAFESIEGANSWLDCYYDLAFHTTEGYRLVFETETHMISLGADGVTIQNKCAFAPYPNEWLEETIHVFEDIPDYAPIVNFKNTLFVGQRILSVEHHGTYHSIQFDDFELKLIPHPLGTHLPLFRNKDHWSYNLVRGFDRFLTATCPHCNGTGEILLDFVADYVVRCKQCKHSTHAEMEIRHAIDHWNKGEVPCDLSDIVIE